MSADFRDMVFRNALWFAGSLFLAMLVWFVATIEADPIGQRIFQRVDIQIQLGDDMIVTDVSSDEARVVVRGQQSTLQLLQEDDIIVRADLTDYESGTHVVPLAVDISRPATADTQPTQITISIEQVIARQMPVEISIVPPSINYTYDTPNREVFQAEVRGAPSAVNQVVAVRGQLDLSDQEQAAQVERTLTLVPVDEAGDRVSNVTVMPRTVVVNTEVTQREDVREFAVRPAIQFDTLPENFEFRNLIDYDPDTVIISGPPEALAGLRDPLDTEQISLEGRTQDFTVDVPLDLPDDSRLIILSERSTVSVSISISEQQTTLPLENIPVTVVGLPQGYTATVNQNEISVVLNGPVSTLEDINASDVQAIINANGLAAGTSTVVPQISINQGQVNLSPDAITLLPSELDITINLPPAESTVAPDATPASDD